MDLTGITAITCPTIAVVAVLKGGLESVTTNRRTTIAIASESGLYQAAMASLAILIVALLIALKPAITANRCTIARLAATHPTLNDLAFAAAISISAKAKE